jgi:hypothetical protein
MHLPKDKRFLTNAQRRARGLPLVGRKPKKRAKRRAA